MLVTPKYIIGHIVVIAATLTCFTLSYWQFSRLSERKELNARIEERMNLDPVKLTDILLPRDGLDIVQGFEFRRISVTGSYNKDGEILISGRARDGKPGYVVVTPLELTTREDLGENPNVVYVARGWIPQSLGDALRDGSASFNVIAPQDGYEEKRTVSGLVRLNEKKVLFGETKQVQTTSSRINTSLFYVRSKTSEENMYPLWVHMTSESIKGKSYPDVNDESYPQLLELPELTERNHFSYAIQWFCFGVLAAVTWIVICVNAVKNTRKTQVAR